MKTLIDCMEVTQLAFSADELINTEVVTLTDILEAEERFLRPVLGDELITALHNGSYPTLLSEYVAPALAQWTRYVSHPLFEIRSSTHDKSRHQNTYAQSKHNELMIRTLHRKAVTLSRRLSHHLNSHSDEYPEYAPEHNQLNRCSIDGYIIQVW